MQPLASTLAPTPGRPLTIALIGIGGYGNMYCSAFVDARFSAQRLIGVVDPAPAGCKWIECFQEMGVPIHASLAELKRGPQPDLAIVSSPMQFHAEHTCELLNWGCHVLCEKPLCTSLEQVRRMIWARDAAKRTVAVGYQWSFSQAIQSLKKDLLKGRFGAPLQFKTAVLWPRDDAYYARNRWVDDQGRSILDGPANNACAHYLHNMLFLLGPQMDRSAHAVNLQSELYRAYPIENHDTAALRCSTTSGAEIVFCSSHVNEESEGPMFELRCENGVISYAHPHQKEIIARCANGEIINYGSPEESHYQKLLSTIDAIRGGHDPMCGIEAAAAQVELILAMQQGSRVRNFPKHLVEHIGETGKTRLQVRGLQAVLRECYRTGQLPSELHADWASSSEVVKVQSSGEPTIKVSTFPKVVRQFEENVALAVESPPSV